MNAEFILRKPDIANADKCVVFSEFKVNYKETRITIGDVGRVYLWLDRYNLNSTSATAVTSQR
jgi:hypothetical protein